MNIEVKGVHFDVGESTRNYLDKKLDKLDHAREDLVDLLFTLTKETRGYTLESHVHFRWGAKGHITVKTFDLNEGIDKLIDKLVNKVNKERKKVKEH
ncbi:MAG: ribosome-associated translation inhibitor RaiA [Spirochaetales bacterium]|nr:ribosome-associated translation inhibitor RaiA [Spirochaetales bacterium]MCF7939259.1 ribosome-associated translation inhibitor RaiA [Spirochaetales bacterium]